MEKSFNLKLPAELHAKIRDEAHRRGISIAALVREAIERMLGG